MLRVYSLMSWHYRNDGLTPCERQVRWGKFDSCLHEVHTPSACDGNLTRPTVQVGEADFFWEANGRNQFPDAAAQVEAEVQKYKQVGY